MLKFHALEKKVYNIYAHCEFFVLLTHVTIAGLIDIALVRKWSKYEFWILKKKMAKIIADYVPMTSKSSKFKGATQDYVVKLPNSAGARLYCPKIQHVHPWHPC